MAEKQQATCLFENCKIKENKPYTINTFMKPPWVAQVQQYYLGIKLEICF